MGLPEFSGSLLTPLQSSHTILARREQVNRTIDRILLEYTVAVLVAIATEDEEQIIYLHSLMPLMRVLRFLRDIQ